MQTALLYTIFSILIGLTSIVSLSNMLLYPLTTFQKFIVFIYTFSIVQIQQFFPQPFSFSIALLLIVLGTLFLIVLFQNHKIVNFLCAVFNFCISLAINYILIKLFSHFAIDEFFFRKYPYIFCPYLVIQIICCYFVSHVLYKILMLFLRNSHREQQLTQQLAQAEAMKDYTNRIEKLYLDIRSFKHDYINILSSFHSYINEHDYEGLEKYFNQEILPAGSKIAPEDSIYGRLGYIEEPKIKSIVYIKIFRAFKLDINVTTDIREKINDFPVNVTDLVRILGILLDNAIEASAATDKKLLSISFLKDSEGIYIQIHNSSPQIDNVEQLYRIDVSSKDDGRGFGLYEVRKILDQYPNALLNTEYKDFIFSQKLALLYT